MTPENELENDPENEILNDFLNGVQNDLENEGNRISDGKNAEENENPFLENAEKMSVENDSKMDVENADEMEDDFEDDQEGFEDDFEDEFDFPEDDFEDDPLDDAISGEAEEKPMDDLISEITGDSVKNLELLEELGELAMEKIDDSKAMLCSAISGESPARYASDKKLNKALLKAFANYLRSNNVKAPSPLGSLLLVLAMWGLPTLGAAFFHRSQAKKAAKKQAAKKVKEAAEDIEDIEIEGEAKSDTPETAVDYSHLKEYQENRRMFTVHKTKGVYNRAPNGDFARISLASEKPSPEIQQMLEDGLTCAAIRERIYNE